MDLVDLIEKRRFVGREHLLLLWMESELFEGTLSIEEHGSFGLWLEKTLVLSAETESTRVAASSPGLGRQAKEALLRGQLPESVGIRVFWKDEETSLVLTGESLAIRALKLRTELGGETPVGDLVDELARASGGGRKPKKAPRDAEAEDDTPFYERMTMARAIEGLLEALYRDFLALRLSPRWDDVVVPTLRRWAEGEPVDVEAYRAARAARSAQSARPAKGRARR
ncbi:MAG: hypothetical protein KF901_34765 [Myxococcales bacterium]|nr:hypothetical protein [Myxococcales bacterium]